MDRFFSSRIAKNVSLSIISFHRAQI